MQTGTLDTIRRILLATLVLGIVGLVAELLLLEHFDKWTQYIPLSVLGIAAIALTWYGIGRTRASVRAVQGIMVLCIIVGAVGVVLHFRGNAEFEREMSPGIAGFAFIEAVMMGATPTLAPGAMIQLGLIGLAWTFRHPLLSTRSSSTQPRIGEHG